MIDFNKLREDMKDPNYRKSMRERMEAEAQKLDQKHKANVKMAGYLMDLVENDKISEDYDRGFIRSVHSRLRQDLPLTEKQQTYLDKCYHEKY